MHMAIQTAQVMVGVMKILNWLDHPQKGGQKSHPAHAGHGGQTTIGQQEVGNENIGKAVELPTSQIQVITGIQNSVGEPHGARGAQFIGIEIHAPHPNQHHNQFTRSSIQELMASIFALLSQPIDISQSSASNSNTLHPDSSSLSGIQLPLVSLLNSASCSLAYFSDAVGSFFALPVKSSM